MWSRSEHHCVYLEQSRNLEISLLSKDISTYKKWKTHLKSIRSSNSSAKFNSRNQHGAKQHTRCYVDATVIRRWHALTWRLHTMTWRFHAKRRISTTHNKFRKIMRKQLHKNMCGSSAAGPVLPSFCTHNPTTITSTCMLRPCRTLIGGRRKWRQP